MDKDVAHDGNKSDADSQARPDATREGPAPGGCPRRVPAARRDAPPVDSGAEGPGCLSNTQAITSPTGLPSHPEVIVAGGLDWFEFSMSLRWREGRLEQLAAKLKEAKSLCQIARKSDTWVELPDIGPVRVGRMGLNLGGDRGQHFEFKLWYYGVLMGLANRPVGSDTLANFYVRQTGRDCLLLDAQHAYDLAGAFVEAAGADVLEEKLHRVDMCMDFAGLDVRELQEPVEQGHFITNGSSVRPYVELPANIKTGFSAGKRPLYLVVYDKAAEQLGKTDMLYIRALKDRRWGGVFPEKAARVEYQISRPWLKDRGIDSPADFFRLQGSIVKLLLNERFRLTAGPVDRKNNNQKRAATLPLWLEIEAAFAEVYGRPAGEVRRVKRDKVDNPIALLKQLRGVLASVILQKRIVVDNYTEFAEAGRQQLLELIDSTRDATEFMRRLECRRTEYLP